MVQAITPQPHRRCRRAASRRSRASACRASRAFRRGRHGGAFTLIEVLVAILIIGVLLGILIPVVARVRTSAKTVTCLSNLRQLAGAFHQYAADHNDRYPDPSASDISWETALADYVPGTGLFICPADQEMAAAVGASYDWRDTGKPATTLAGRPTSDVRATNFVLVFDSLPNWHAKGTMNAAMADGSASTMDDQACLADLARPIAEDHSPPATNGPRK